MKNKNEEQDEKSETFDDNGDVIDQPEIDCLTPDVVQKDFHLSDIYDFARKGVLAIVDDEVTKRFHAEGLSLACLN